MHRPLTLVGLLCWLVASGAEKGEHDRRRLSSVLFGGGGGEKQAAAATAGKKADAGCVKFGAQFDVPLQGTNVVLDCPSASGAANKKVCCAAHFPTQQQAVLNNTYVTRSSLAASGSGHASSSSRGVGWSYEPTAAAGGGQHKASSRRLTSLSAAQLSDTDLANAASILQAGKASARASVTCTVTKVYHSSPQELRDLAMAKVGGGWGGGCIGPRFFVRAPSLSLSLSFFH